MSEAPCLMASRRTLFTKRTIGASSTALVSVSSISLEVSSTISRSNSVLSPSWSISEFNEFCWSNSSVRSLARTRSSTTTASVLMPVANLISSSAAMFVGSARAMNKRLPRLKIGIVWCLLISAAETSLSGNELRSIADKSSKGTPNSADAISARS